MNRGLSLAETDLIRWMLEHGKPEAQAYLSQLERAEVTHFQCPCGCASINLSVDGAPEPTGTLHILADYLFGTEDDLSGVFVFQKNGTLAGLEVYGLAGEAPKTLPLIESLRPFSDGAIKQDPQSSR